MTEQARIGRAGFRREQCIVASATALMDIEICQHAFEVAGDHDRTIKFY